MSNAQRILIIIAIVALLAGVSLLVLYLTGAFNAEAPGPESSAGTESSVPSSDVSDISGPDESQEDEDPWDETWTLSGEYDPAVFSEYDRNTDYSDPDATIVCDGANAKVKGTGAIASNGTIAISQGGTYVLQGSYRGRLLIEVGETEKVHLVFDNFSITCAAYSPVLASVADKVCVTLADGTENEVIDTGTGYVKGVDELEEIEGRSAGALHAKCDLTINGNGKLTVKGNYRHGIFSKNDLRILSGRIEVTASSSGIKGKKSITLGGGSVRVSAEGDGFKVTETQKEGKGFFRMTDGVITADAKGDGIDAVLGVYIEGGRMNIHAADHAVCTDGTLEVSGKETVLRLSSTAAGKGLRAFGDLTVYDGTIDILRASEGISSAGGNVCVKGGTIRIQCTDEGLEALKELTIEGGSIVIDSEMGGIGADSRIVLQSGVLLVGGPETGPGGIVELNVGNGVTASWFQEGTTFIGCGNPEEISSPRLNSSVPVLIIEGEFKKETVYALREENGDTLGVFRPVKDGSVLLLSFPSMEKGKTYELLSGVNPEGESDGLFESTSFTGGSVTASVNISSVVMTVQANG